MLRHTLIVWLLLTLTGFSTAVEAERGLQRIEGAVPDEIRRQVNFDAGESAGLFVGVRSFEDKHFAEVPYAVDDAVDLAHLFAVELSLVAPERVILALTGEPQKKSTQDRLQALLEAGARQQPAGWADIYEHLTESRKATGPRGVLVVSLATHGFNEDGHDYLVGADSRRRFITRSGIVVSEVLDEITQATAPRRLVLLDACRERLTRQRASGGPDAQSAMGDAFAEAIAAAKGQVVLSGTTLGGYSYDDMSRGNGVFTGAILDGLRGAAPADERHFITARTLADYVNAQVLQWVRDNRPDRVQLSRGISQQIEGTMARAPLAIDPGGMRGKEQARQEGALQKLRDNLGGPITGSLYDLIKHALDRSLPLDFRAELLDELEALDGSVRSKRSLAYWVDQHRKRLLEDEPDPVPTTPSPASAELPDKTAEAVEAGLRLTREDVRLIQLGLAAEGYDAGPADGLLGKTTRGAIRNWQASRGEEVTGHLDVESAKVLLASGRERQAQEREAEAASAASEALDLLHEAIDLYDPQDGQVDYARARELFEQAAQSGRPLAVMWLARSHFGGRVGFRKDVGRGQELARSVIREIRQMAGNGDGEASFLLGSAYDEGLATSKNPELAVSWYRKAADQGHAHAQTNLGVMYENGRGVSQSDREAVKWYRLAAGQGHADAQFNMCWMYKNGRGVSQSDREVVKWCRLAADQGHARAQFNMCWMYKNGRGVSQSDREVVKWCRLAADQGHARAQTGLGWMYQNGRGVSQSDREAVKWYRLAADQGEAYAQFNLGVMYENGRGVSQSDREAVKWYRLAADQGHAHAQNNLGVMYQNGRGVSQSDREAVKWYRLAADQGHARAQTGLGWMYQNGRGVS